MMFMPDETRLLPEPPPSVVEGGLLVPGGSVGPEGPLVGVGTVGPLGSGVADGSGVWPETVVDVVGVDVSGPSVGMTGSEVPTILTMLEISLCIRGKSGL